MNIIKYQLPIKLMAVSVVVIAALFAVISTLSPITAASSVVGMTSNIAEVPNGENLKLTITTQNDGDIAELEVDHSLQGILPEFSVYANEAAPWGDASDKAGFDANGVTMTYSEAKNQWVIDFGPTVTQVIRDNGGTITFYLVLRSADNTILWGSMDGPIPAESTFSFDVVNGTGSEVIPSIEAPEVTPEAPVVPKVPNTGISL